MSVSGNYFLGIDAGSTTVKFAVLDPDGAFVSGGYERHRSDPRSTLISLMEGMLDDDRFVDAEFSVAVTGSGGISLAGTLGLPFVQEVVASSAAVRRYLPTADVAIELGGEDAKITYFSGGVEQRMNGACAGGTGAFIDQMAALLNTDAPGLNELAKGATTIYPIAARCGVFAKTDVQPLINEGARKEDIAASVFQAVVNQTISGLACGKPIKGRVAFLGGPLHFLPESRKRFEETLKLTEDETLVPENSQLFVAIGAALWVSAQNADPAAAPIGTDALRHRVRALCLAPVAETARLRPLFESEDERREFDERHAAAKARRRPLEAAAGPCFLGIDAGSTTTKMALIDADGALLAERYEGNGGAPLAVAVAFLADLYRRLPEGAWIGRSCSTGYGEAIVQAGLSLDQGEVETVAHFRAAREFEPEVDFVLDIGGQDMKCLRAADGAISSILLNEACSSGCGSFVETFAHTLGFDAPRFAGEALDAASPSDLGTRCTVFMNSRVKQAQKEGASVSDISAGLAYSVVKNALFKVIKLRDPAALGKHPLVQGGTFLNDAILRAFELISGRNAVRPDIAYLMGAYGAALLARDAWRDAGADGEARSATVGPEAVAGFSVATSMRRCDLCPNSCLLTITDFGNGGRFVSGNRCERGALAAGGAGLASARARKKADASSVTRREGSEDLNLFAWKLSRLFSYSSLPDAEASRGTIGIPRTLETYEHYPYWHTFFTKLGYRVALSPRSTRKVYEAGLSSMPSESVCFPGKLVHGHVERLLSAGVKTIFHPCVPVEAKEDSGADNRFNCPVVTSYSEVIKNNVEGVRSGDVRYLNPFLPFDDQGRLVDRLVQEFSGPDCPEAEVRAAADAAWAELAAFRAEVRAKGEAFLAQAAERNVPVLVLAGRPYHLDPEINHGIPELAASLGWAVLTEDSVAHLGRPLLERPLRVVDQWTFHSRLYAAAAFAASRPDVEFAQLVSFGCGLDAVTADQAEEILRARGKLYTLLKIDEGANLGAVRIRLRSLTAAVEERRHRGSPRRAPQGPAMVSAADAASSLPQDRLVPAERPIALSPLALRNLGGAGAFAEAPAGVPGGAPSSGGAGDRVCVEASGTDGGEAQPERPVFTEEMRKVRTLLAPQLSPIHFHLVEAAFRHSGYRVEVLPEAGQGAVSAGLKYVNNDACYPSILVVGQLMEALESGRYDPDSVALLITQTGGACRATNYIAFIRRALADAGLSRVPVVSLSAAGLESNPGFRLTLPLVHRGVMALVYGDLLMRMLYRTRPYEVQPGAAEGLMDSWIERLKGDLKRLSPLRFSRNIRRMVRDFDSLPIAEGRKPRVGVVGEILVKFHPGANGNIVGEIEKEGAEAVVPDFLDFFFYSAHTGIFKHRDLSASFKSELVSRIAVFALERYRASMRRALKKSRRFDPPTSIYRLAAAVDGVVQTGNIAGEGWFLTAEMLELIESGVLAIACVQPFACLPNHITGKGVIKELRRLHPEATISAIDYDPGASEVNQINRLKLLLSTARS